MNCLNRRLIAATVWLAAGLVARVAVIAAAQSGPSPFPDLVGDAQSLDQPTPAARLEAVQALLKKRGISFSLQPIANAPRPGQNVVIDLGGPPAAQEIILGAHLDTARLPDGTFSHGMVDNGAGVAVMTRVAATLRTATMRHRVRVVLFDLEENGLLGSRHFATTVDKSRVRFMVNVDIAGYGDTLLSGPASAPGTSSLQQAFTRVCAAADYQCVRFQQFPPSDDQSFQAVGIPAISLAVLPAVEAHQLWLMFHGGKESGLAPGFVPAILRTIHTPQDTAEKLTEGAMTLMHRAVLALVAELDAR